MKSYEVTLTIPVDGYDAESAVKEFWRLIEKEGNVWSYKVEGPDGYLEIVDADKMEE